MANYLELKKLMIKGGLSEQILNASDESIKSAVAALVDLFAGVE